MPHIDKCLDSGRNHLASAQQSRAHFPHAGTPVSIGLAEAERGLRHQSSASADTQLTTFQGHAYSCVPPASDEGHVGLALPHPYRQDAQSETCPEAQQRCVPRH